MDATFQFLFNIIREGVDLFGDEVGIRYRAYWIFDLFQLIIALDYLTLGDSLYQALLLLAHYWRIIYLYASYNAK